MRQTDAEAVPWRCHRSLVADALIVRGNRVEHIMNGRTFRVHSLTSLVVCDAIASLTPSTSQARPRTTTSPLPPDTTACMRLKKMVSYGPEASPSWRL
jgi:hypothetical protein